MRPLLERRSPVVPTTDIHAGWVAIAGPLAPRFGSRLELQRTFRGFLNGREWHLPCTEHIRQRLEESNEKDAAMERMLAVVFDSEARALEGSRALEDMGEYGTGSIGVHAIRVVSKDSDGKTTVVSTYDPTPEGAMGGTAIGTLIGMLGGPLGLVVGAVGGFVAGAATDFGRSHVDDQFLSTVSNALAAGKTAVVAEIYEESTDPIDGYMKTLGGVVHRRDLSDVVDSTYQHDVAGIEADLARTKAEHGRSRAEHRKTLQARIDALEEKLRSSVRRAGSHTN
jgi:uncharacterized membrane protein